MPPDHDVPSKTKAELIKQACESCRRRKLKCTKQLPKCEKCRNHGWSCCYTPKIERTPLTRKLLTQMEIRCWKLDRLIARLVTDQSIEELLETIPEPTEEDFVKKSAQKPKKLLHDGQIISLRPEEKIHDYIGQLNIPAKITKGPSSFSQSSGSKHKRSKSSLNSLDKSGNVKKESDSWDDFDNQVVTEDEEDGAEEEFEEEEEEEEDEGDEGFLDNAVDDSNPQDQLDRTGTNREPHSRRSDSSHVRTIPKESEDVRPVTSNIVLSDPLYGLDWKEEIASKLLASSKRSNNDNDSPSEFVLSDISDGMAALNLNPEGKGYYGIASSAETVRNLNISYEALQNNSNRDHDHDHNAPRSDRRKGQKGERKLSSANAIIPILPSSNSTGSKLSTGTIPSVPTEASSSKDSRDAATMMTTATTTLTKKFNLTLAQANEYVTAYFEYYHTSYPFIHKRTFMKNYEDPSLLTEDQKKSFEILRLTVCALGCWCISDIDSNLDLFIYQEARKKLGFYVFEHGNIFVTQALVLLSNYIQKRDFPNTGWAYLGTAVRHALGLALHETIKGASPLEQEIRNRIWWGLYIFDVGTAITWGRPIHLPNLDEVKIECIKNIPDEEFDDASNDESFSYSDRDFPTEYSGFIAQIHFTHISSKIYNRTLSKRKLPLKECLELNTEIESFSARLPNYLSFDTNVFEKAINTYYTSKSVKAPTWLYLTRYRLLWRVKNLQTVLFKSVILYKKTGLFVKGDSKEVFESITLCLDSSRQTIESVTDYFHKHESHRLAAWYSIYFSFQAIVIPMFCLLKEPNSKFSTQWLHDLHFLRMVLSYLQNKSPLCKKFIKLIEGATEKCHALQFGSSNISSNVDVDTFAKPRRSGSQRANKRRHSNDGENGCFTDACSKFNYNPVDANISNINGVILRQSFAESFQQPQPPPVGPPDANNNMLGFSGNNNGFPQQQQGHQGPINIKLEHSATMIPASTAYVNVPSNQQIPYGYQPQPQMEMPNLVRMPQQRLTSQSPQYAMNPPATAPAISQQMQQAPPSQRPQTRGFSGSPNANPLQDMRTPPGHEAFAPTNVGQPGNVAFNGQGVARNFTPGGNIQGGQPRMQVSMPMQQQPQLRSQQQMQGRAPPVVSQNQIQYTHPQNQYAVHLSQPNQTVQGIPAENNVPMGFAPEFGGSNMFAMLQVPPSQQLQQAGSSAGSSDIMSSASQEHPIASTNQAFNTLNILFEDEDVDSSAYLYALNIQDINQYEFTYGPSVGAQDQMQQRISHQFSAQQQQLLQQQQPAPPQQNFN